SPGPGSRGARRRRTPRTAASNTATRRLRMHPSKLRITPLQLAMLLIPGIASTAILGLPAVTVTFARQDAWLAPLAAAPAAALVIWIAGRLAQRFPGETFIEYAPRVLG